MWFFPLLSYVLALILTLSGVQYHINIYKYPFYLGVPVTLAVFIPLSIIFLLPADYVVHNTKGDDGEGGQFLFALPDKVILYMWKSNYWITFLLTWLILPVLQEFFKSGSHDRILRLKDAFKRNLKFQLAILGVGILGIVYLTLEVGLSMGHMKLMIIAIAHIYSLVLALWLMAHGLVSIPRKRWMRGNLMQNLNHLYLKVPQAVDLLEDTKITFKEELLQVLYLYKNFTSNSDEDFQYRDWIIELYRLIPAELREAMENQYLNDNNIAIGREDLTVAHMKKLAANFHSGLHKLKAYESEFNTLLHEIVYLEDLINAGSNDSQGGPQVTYRLEKRISLLLPKARFYLEYYIHPIYNRILSIVLFLASFVIIESEFFHSTHLSIINYIVYSGLLTTHNILRFATCSIIFSYMLFASLNSLTSLKIFNKYHLVPHESDPVSACFYTTYVARLTIPLSYNFITLFISRASIFENWFGESIHLTGLFNLLNNWLPRLLLLPVCLTTFNVYDKLKKKIGLDSSLYDSWAIFDDFDSDENRHDFEANNNNNKRKDLIIVEAKRIVNREVFKLTQQGDNIRTFNLASASNLNHDSNIQNFHDSLASPNQRIDASIHDDTNNQNQNQHIDDHAQNLGQNVWSKLNNAFTGWRTNVSERLQLSNVRSYRDVPIEDFTYDDDANERLTL